MNSRLTLIYLTSFVSPFSTNAVLALVPDLKGAFDATAPQILTSVTAYMIPYALLMLISGATSDSYGRRQIVTAGLGIFAVGSAVIVFSPDLGVFLAGRAVQGAGFALVQPILQALLGDIVPHEELGKAMGYSNGASAAGVASGPIVAGVMALIDWRGVFVFTGIYALIALILFLKLFENDRVTERPKEGVATVLKKGARSKGIVPLCIAGFLTFLSYIGMMSFVSDLLSLPPLRLDESYIGIVLGIAGLSGVAISPFSGRVSDKFGRFFGSAMGFSIMIAALILITLSSNIIEYIITLSLLRIGTSFSWSSMLATSVEISPRYKGAVSSIFNTVRYSGYALAPVAFTPLYNSIDVKAIGYAGAIGTAGAFICIAVARSILNKEEGKPFRLIK